MASPKVSSDWREHVSGADNGRQDASVIFLPTGRVFTDFTEALSYVRSGSVARDEADSALDKLRQMRHPAPLRPGWSAHVKYVRGRGNCVLKEIYYKWANSDYDLRFDTLDKAAKADEIGCDPDAAMDAESHNETIGHLRRVVKLLMAEIRTDWDKVRNSIPHPSI